MEEGKKKVKVPRRPNRPLLVLVSLLVVALIAVNGLFWGLVNPHLDIVNVFTARPDATTEEYKQAAQATADITEEVESEGIVLLKNDGGLPLGGTTKVNVLGSTAGNNFSYGGTGSGAGHEDSNVTFYQGLENAGLEVNPELKSFYDANAVEATKYLGVGTDWNLYELPQSAYEDGWAAKAREYSDTAVVVITRKGGIKPLPTFNKVLDVVINFLRSVPFIILLVMLFPVTRVVMGTSVGTRSIIFPLFVSAFPFVARMVESSLNEVDAGLIEAAQSMGSTTMQIIRKVLLPEALPSLISGAAICVTTILAYTAMAGAAGGDGLGKIAITYGLNRREYGVMYAASIALVVLVQVFQLIGNILTKALDHRHR